MRMNYANAKGFCFCKRSPRLDIICRYSLSNSQYLFQTYQKGEGERLFWVNCDVILVIKAGAVLGGHVCRQYHEMIDIISAKVFTLLTLSPKQSVIFHGSLSSLKMFT